MNEVAPIRSGPYAALLQLNDEAQNARKGMGRFFGRREETIYRAAFLQTFAYAARKGGYTKEYYDFHQELLDEFAARNYDRVRELIEENVIFTVGEDTD